MNALLRWKRARLVRWWVRGILANAAVVVIACLVGLLMVELCLRAFNPVEMRVKGDKIVLYPNARQILDGSAWPKFDRTIVQTRNVLGLRGENPPSDFDHSLSIIAMGGSTTECYYLSDGKSWPERLGLHLRSAMAHVWVNNAGMDGQTTFGHQKLLEQHVAGLKPKVITIMAGINDKALAAASLYDGNVRPNAGPPGGFKDRMVWTLSRHSELFALGLAATRSFRATKGGVGHGNIDFAASSHTDVSPEAEAAILAAHQPFLPAYRQRLEQLVATARESGIEPILITQTAMWGEGRDPTTGQIIDQWTTGSERLADGTVVAVNARVSWHVVEAYNDVMRQVGHDAGVHVADLAHLLPKNTLYFYDWMHMSNAGADTVARILAADLCPVLAARFPEQTNGTCPAMPDLP